MVLLAGEAERAPLFAPRRWDRLPNQPVDGEMPRLCPVQNGGCDVRREESEFDNLLNVALGAPGATRDCSERLGLPRHQEIAPFVRAYECIDQVLV